MSFQPRSIRLWGALSFVAASAVGCSSSAPPTPSSARVALDGTYVAPSGSDITTITFSDGDRYTLMRSCASSAGGCPESGSYDIEAAATLLVLTNEVTGASARLPLQVLQTDGTAGTTTQAVHIATATLGSLAGSEALLTTPRALIFAADGTQFQQACPAFWCTCLAACGSDPDNDNTVPAVGESNGVCRDKLVCCSFTKLGGVGEGIGAFSGPSVVSSR